MRSSLFITVVTLLGCAVVALAAGGCGQSGVQDPLTSVTGVSGPPAAQPAIVGLTANPTTVVVSSASGQTTTLSAQVVDAATHVPIMGTAVAFSASLGTLAQPNVVTDQNGVATDQLTFSAGTSTTMVATSARAQGGSQSASVQVSNLATITASASPSSVGCPNGSSGVSIVQGFALDQANNPVPNVTLAFSADRGAISPRATTDANGRASATLTVSPGTADGRDTVIVQASGVSGATIIQVTGCGNQTPAPPPTGSNTLQFISAVPTQIGVQGSTLPQQSTVTFKLTDSVGNPISGTTVNFFISAVGGESISPTSAATAADGTVQTVLTSGKRATVTQVSASTGALAATSTPISIVGGLPVQGRMSASPQFVNIAGNVTAGLNDQIQIVMSDRYSNPVQPGTAIQVQSLGGSAHASATSDQNGIAIGVLTSGNPTNPTDLNGTPTGGIATALAFTRGETPFIDANNNGVFDPGETVIAVGEPFFDLNGNGLRDPNEPFIDLNNNGHYDTDQSGGQFSQNIITFISTRVTFSGATKISVSPPSGFLIPNNGSQQFTLSLVDSFGNPLVGGTTYHVSSSPAGSVQGADGVVPDGQSFGHAIAGLNQFTFTVNDSDNINSAIPITLTITVTSPPSTTAPGGNGNSSAQVGGTMQ